MIIGLELLIQTSRLRHRQRLYIRDRIINALKGGFVTVIEGEAIFQSDFESFARVTRGIVYAETIAYAIGFHLAPLINAFINLINRIHDEETLDSFHRSKVVYHLVVL